MKKFLSLIIFVSLVNIGGYTVQAEEENADTDSASMQTEAPKMQMPKLTDEQKEQLEALRKEHKAAMDELFAAMKEATTDEEKQALREKIKALNEAHMAAVKEIAPELGNMPKMGEKEGKNKNEMKPPMKMEGMGGEMMKMPELTDEQKEQIKEIMESFKADMDAIHEAMKKATSEEDKKYVAEKMKALRDAQIEKIAAISPEMAEHMKKMEEMMKDKMKGGKGGDTNMQTWEDKKGGEERVTTSSPNSMMGKYKEAFAKKLGDKLASFSDEKLQKVLTKIEAAEEKINASSMAESKKEKLLAQLEALKELINEHLSTSEDEEINLDELFAE